MNSDADVETDVEKSRPSSSPPGVGRARTLLEVELAPPCECPGEAELMARAWAQRQPYVESAGLSRPQPRYLTRPAHAIMARVMVDGGPHAVGVGLWEPMDDGVSARPFVLVDESQRGRGVGALLLRWVYEDAREHGRARLLAQVERDAGKLLRLAHRIGHHPRVQFGSGHVTFDVPLQGG